MPLTKQVKRKVMETEQDKRLKEIKRIKLEENLQSAINQEEALNILRELLFLTNDKKYSDEMHKNMVLTHQKLKYQTKRTNNVAQKH